MRAGGVYRLTQRRVRAKRQRGRPNMSYTGSIAKWMGGNIDTYAVLAINGGICCEWLHGRWYILLPFVPIEHHAFI